MKDGYYHLVIFDFGVWQKWMKMDENCNHHLVIFDGGEDVSVDGDHHLVIFGGGVDENG